MTTATLHEGDNREHLRRLIDQGVRVHAVVTDPPYGLTSVVKRFGKEGAAPAKHGTDGAFARASGGFMGKAWDGTGIERDPEFWRLIWEILLPGGFVFAFSGSRTGHWQACAMETAGFIMHPMHGWVYGSGFPKATNISKIIDKADGRQGAITPNTGKWKGGQSFGGGAAMYAAEGETTVIDDSYVPRSPEAVKWIGWRTGTQSQKPALEPIYLGQKPFSEKTGAANLLKHGVGAVNIDGCRVPTDDILGGGAYAQDAADRGGEWQNDDRSGGQGSGFQNGGAGEFIQPQGRWPANLLHDGSPEVVALFPDSNGSGSAARFFNSFPLTEEDYLWATDAGLISEPPDADAIVYQAKATKADRAGSKHPTVKPIALMQHLIRHITPPGGVVLDPFAGSGTTAEAARREGLDCILMEQDPGYAAFLRERFALPPGAANDLVLDDFLALPTVSPSVAAAFAEDPELALLLG